MSITTLVPLEKKERPELFLLFPTHKTSKVRGEINSLILMFIEKISSIFYIGTSDKYLKEGCEIFVVGSMTHREPMSQKRVSLCGYHDNQDEYMWACFIYGVNPKMYGV